MKKIRRLLLFILIICLISIIGIGLYGYKYYKETVGKVPVTSKILEIREGYTFIKKEDVPKEYLNAIISVEDHRYYSHGAIDLIGIARAIVTNAKNKQLQEGGSTITQQVAKNIYFIEEVNVIKRKVAEIFTAIELEKNYSKDEILELYINTIYFGDGYYGIKEACNGYLHKEPKDMNLSEATMMAGIPNAPSVYAPTANKELCKKRQAKVISSMIGNNYITKEEAEKLDSSFIDNIE